VGQRGGVEARRGRRRRRPKGSRRPEPEAAGDENPRSEVVLKVGGTTWSRRSRRRAEGSIPGRMPSKHVGPGRTEVSGPGRGLRGLEGRHAGTAAQGGPPERRGATRHGGGERIEGGGVAPGTSGRPRQSSFGWRIRGYPTRDTWPVNGSLLGSRCRQVRRRTGHRKDRQVADPSSQGRSD